MKTKHDVDCTIYSSLINNNCTDGICTCGLGLSFKKNGCFCEMYSEERWNLIDLQANKTILVNPSKMWSRELACLNTREEDSIILKAMCKVKRNQNDKKRRTNKNTQTKNKTR